MWTWMTKTKCKYWVITKEISVSMPKPHECFKEKKDMPMSCAANGDFNQHMNSCSLITDSASIYCSSRTCATIQLLAKTHQTVYCLNPSMGACGPGGLLMWLASTGPSILVHIPVWGDSFAGLVDIFVVFSGFCFFQWFLFFIKQGYHILQVW